jgi:hypothetical protein
MGVKTSGRRSSAGKIEFVASCSAGSVDTQWRFVLKVLVDTK